MRKKSKKHIYLPLALALYATVMAVIGYPKAKKMGELTQFWFVYGATLVLAVIIHFLYKRREQNRDKFRD